MTTIIEPAPEQPPRRQRSLFTRIVRFPLKLILLVIFGAGVTVRRHPRVSGGVLAALVIAGGLVYYFTPAMMPTPGGTLSTPSVTLTSSQGLLPSPQTPTVFFKAQQAGDANTMWGLLSDNFKQGISLQQLETQMNQIKPRMGVIKQITYVGGARELNGNAVYLYLLTLDQGGQTDQVTYLFTLDPQGKIVKIE